MYTQCTECKQQQLLTIKDIRSSQGIIRCSHCSLMFNALEHLSEKPLANQFVVSEVFSPHELTTQRSMHWNLWIALCFIILSFQIYYFEGHNFTQNSLIRPWLTTACQTLNCKLPIYKNLNELTVLHGSFQTMTKHHSIFKTAFVNHASFKQNLPSIKLTLQGFTGDDFAERIFYPKDYMTTSISIMKPDMSIEIALDIATPSDKMGGYRFELI